MILPFGGWGGVFQGVGSDLMEMIPARRAVYDLRGKSWIVLRDFWGAISITIVTTKKERLPKKLGADSLSGSLSC